MTSQTRAKDTNAGKRRASIERPAAGTGPAVTAPLILVAEDSLTQARWLRMVLEAARYRVVVAADGLDALRLAAAERPAIILADVDMPGINGFEVCRRVKEDPALRSIPYVMVTHRDRVTDLVQALEAGADNYLTKPLDESTVLARIDRILGDVRSWHERSFGRRTRLSIPTEEIVLSLERAQVVEMLMASAQKLEQELGTVSEVGLALTMTHDLDEVLHLLVQRTLELSDAEAVAVLIRSDEGTWSVGAATARPGPPARRPVFSTTDAEMPFDVDRLLRRERHQVRWQRATVPEGARVWAAEVGIVESYVWPLVLEGSLIGVLALNYTSHKSLTADEDRRFRYLADQAALGVVNARLFERERALREQLEVALIAERDAHKNAMFMLAAAVEARDGLTGSHLRRVQGYAEALARALGLPDDVVEEIGYSSVLHDVGKLLVPDDILGKPGSLTDDEWVEMRRHPEHGAQVLGDRPFFAMARDIARCHHERWDGSGYPAGLRGEEIPLAARITSVADVFDALTTRRHYKDAWSEEDAIAELRRLSGASFDPDVVDAFLRIHAGGEVARLRATAGDG